MSFLAAPLLSLFSLKFYRGVLAWNVRKGLAYLAYMSLLFALVLSWLVKTVVVPQGDQFVDWLKGNMPVLIWNGEILAMKEGTAKEMVHPKYGPLIKFDMTRTEFTDQVLGEFSLGVTPAKAFVRQGSEILKEYNWARSPDQKKGTVEITPELLGKVYVQLKARISRVMIFVLWISVIFWNLVGALFYSWLGLLINWTRRGDKLLYSQLFNIAICAMTPVLVIDSLQLAIPALGRLPFGLVGSLVLTNAYLFFAIRGTDTPPENPAV